MSAPIQPRANPPLEVDVAILGGGIGGLAVAAALRTAGIAAHVYEKTHELKEVGGAVVLRELSVRLFEHWGAAAGFHDQAVQIDVIELRDQHGQPKGTADFVQLGEGNAYSVHRADVHARLLATVDPETIHLGLKSVAVREEGGRGVIRFEDGREVRAKVVVGADGIKSVTRRLVSDDPLMAPRLGQGANQAIQDADALARAISGHGLSDVPAALRQYEQERIPVTKKIQLASRQAPKVQLRHCCP